MSHNETHKLLHYISFYGLLHISRNEAKKWKFISTAAAETFLCSSFGDTRHTHSRVPFGTISFSIGTLPACCVLGIKKGFFAAVSVFLNFLQSAYVFSTVFSQRKDKQMNLWKLDHLFRIAKDLHWASDKMY